MKIFRYANVLLIAALYFLIGCNAVNVSKSDDLPISSPTANTSPVPQITARPKKNLSEIDLATIKHIAPQGRAQDDALEDENFDTLPIASALIAHGKDCIPFLISKLDDETELKRGTIDFWYDVYVGDIALIILNDFLPKMMV